MQLGKALVGALIGGALGIGLLIAAHTFFQMDGWWLAILVALLVGLGVRLMVATKGHASYVRGALTGVVALAAFVLGMQLVAQVAISRANAERTKAPVAVAEETAEKTDATDATATGKVAEERPVMERPAIDPGAMRRAPAPRAANTMDFIWLAVAALLAYELGRGTGMPAPATTTPEGEPVAPPEGTAPTAP
jgi:hypothetical protein